MIIQSAQLIWFASTTLSYYFTAGLVVGLAGSPAAVEPVARWGSVFVLSRERYDGPFVVGLNLVAAGLLAFLLITARRVRNDGGGAHRE